MRVNVIWRLGFFVILHVIPFTAQGGLWRYFVKNDKILVFFFEWVVVALCCHRVCETCFIALSLRSGVSLKRFGAGVKAGP